MKSASSPVDLEIRVTTPWGRGGRSLEFVLSSPSGVVDFYQVTIPGKEIHSPEAFQKRLFRQLEDLHQGRDADGEGLIRREVFEELTAIGHDLYQELFPREMRNAYRELRGRVRTLLIASDEPWIPWEILRPFEHEDDDFLCMKFQMSRWLTGEAPLVSEKRIGRLACLACGEDAGLTNAGEELLLLKELANKTPGLDLLLLPETTSQDVTRLLEKESFDLLHFAGHAQHDEKRPGEAKILLDDRAFRPRHLSPAAEKKLRDERPVVFFNACQVARLDRSLTDLDGWAPRWVRRCGCSVFLAPLWSVDDGRAFQFAEFFYEELREGRSLGEAVLVARHKLRDEDRNEMAWLAYSLYGHPDARITFGDHRPPLSTGGTGFSEESSLAPPEGRRRTTRITHRGDALCQPQSRLAPRLRSDRRRLLGFVAVVSLASFVALFLALDRWHKFQEGEITPIQATARPETPTEGAPAGRVGGAGSSPSEPLPADRLVEHEPPVARSRQAPPSLPIVSGRVGIFALDSATRQPDAQVAAAVETALSSISGTDPVILQADVTYVEDVWGGDFSNLPEGGRSPRGVEYLLIVTAAGKRVPQENTPLEGVTLTMDARLVDVGSRSVRLRSHGTQTGIGPSSEEALLQATGRCLKKIVDILTEGVDDGDIK